MNRFLQVRDILDMAVGGPAAPVFAPHGAFWRDVTRDRFVQLLIRDLVPGANAAISDEPIITLGDGNDSLLVKALRGEKPFGQDLGVPDAEFPRMPAGGRDPVPPDRIAVIAQWIDDSCPEDVPPVAQLEVLLNGAKSGETFVIVSGAAHPFPATLTLRTGDGSSGDVQCRTAQGSGATVTLSPDTVHVSGTPAEVQVLATSASSGQNDTSIEVVQDTEVLARFSLTAIQAPAVRFRGRFQCRLATDSDPFDEPWGTANSSFRVYAVQGPDPAHPDEPPLDRIIRFQDAVALRPFCAPIGVGVIAIEAEVGGSTIRFAAGDPLISQPVRLGPDCKFEDQNGAFAPVGLEPISSFQLAIGSLFSGASAPAAPRHQGEPPASTAPYADGLWLLDTDPTPWAPTEFGYAEKTWAERSWQVVATKLARLVAQQPADDRAGRIRDRRLKEHVQLRQIPSGQRLPGLDFIKAPITLMERYTGLIDRELTITPDPTGALAYLGTLPAIEFYAEFLDFDTDCQTGTVTGTLAAPAAREPAPLEVQARSQSLARRSAPPDE
jgi:hypothetical protein